MSPLKFFSQLGETTHLLLIQLRKPMSIHHSALRSTCRPIVYRLNWLLLDWYAFPSSCLCSRIYEKHWSQVVLSFIFQRKDIFYKVTVKDCLRLIICFLFLNLSLGICTVWTQLIQEPESIFLMLKVEASGLFILIKW